MTVTRAWHGVRGIEKYVRSAPLTHTWLAILPTTTLVQHSLTERTLRKLLQSTSTNLHHLASDLLWVLFGEPAVGRRPVLVAVSDPLTCRRRAPAAAYTPAVATSDLGPADLGYLRRCVQLARSALVAGDEPFGSVLVDASGATLYEDRNRVKDGPYGGDATQHPEFAIARWAAANVSPPERATATVYTSGEHCPICSAAHAWVGLGRIVYATSSAQLTTWLTEWGVPRTPVAALPISAIAPAIIAHGPAPEFADEMKALYEKGFRS